MNSLARSRRPDSCLSDFVLDQLLADTLDPVARGRARAHLTGCVRCSERLSEFENVSVPPLAGALAHPAKSPRKLARPRWLLPAAAALAIVGAVLVLRPKPPIAESQKVAELGTRTKGDITLVVVARRASGQIVRLAPGDAVFPGDSLRFEVARARSGYVAILGVDAAGVTTAYAPPSGAAPELEAGPAVVLEDTIVADDTLGVERIVALLCQEPLQVSELVAKGQHAFARAAGKPERVIGLEPRCAEATFDILKRAGP